MKWCKLGDVVERIERTNADGKYGEEDVRGVSNTKLIQKTKASMAGRDFKPFLVINPKEFVFNRRTTRNGDRLGLGFNQDARPYIFTEDYVAFRVRDERELIPEFLYMFFLRDEFDRYVRWDSWGSATEFFNWENMQLVDVPLPTLAEQREAVAAWQGLRKMKTENEQLAEPLMALCRSYLQDCKKFNELKCLDAFIKERNEINRDGSYTDKDARGVNTNKEIQLCKRMGEDLTGYKIVHPRDFVYNANIKLTHETTKFAVGLYNGANNVIVTNFYTVFSVDESKLIGEYLLLFLARDEFARYVKFISCSSVRDRFDFSDMRKVKIPLPPVEVQRSIVDIYRAAAEAKRIAAEADGLSRKICPALVQKVVAGGAAARTTLTGGRRG